MIREVVKVALEAGKEIMKIYEETFYVEYKEDKTPLTEADKRSHKVIYEGLRSINNDIPILSEEDSHVPYDIRRKWKKFWLVDPLDGTKEFIKKNGEFTVNIALVEGNKPVMSVIYAPALKVLFFSQKGEGAYRLEINEEEDPEDKLAKAERLPIVKNHEPSKLIRVVASRSHINYETKQFIRRISLYTEKVETVSVGSSLKICLVAEGRADVYPRLGPTMEWDTAAGHIIAEESGASVRIYNNNANKELTYNKESLMNPNFVVFRSKLGEYLELLG